MQIRVEELKKVTLEVLAYYGYPQDEAESILEVLMYAQLRGNNQGVVKLIGAGMPRDKSAQPISLAKDTKLSSLVNGGKNTGMVVLSYATDLAIQKAREHGVGIVGTNNTNTSTGAIGYYASRIAKQGYIGLVFAGSGEFMAMYGSYEAIFGTNPLAYGIPTAGKPIVFDMATASIARFGIVEAKTAGRAIPEGVAYDAQGNLTTDPAAALGGAIRVFGGYKGAALALLVEILTHPLVSTSPDANGRKTDWGNLVMAIDPELLSDRGTFEQRVSGFVERLKNAHKLDGVEEILVPGERGDMLLDDAERTGNVEIDDALWSALNQVVK